MEKKHEELCNLYRVPNIKVIKSDIGIGRECNMHQKIINLYKNLVRNIEGNIPCGRPCHMWEFSIKNELGEIG
jgi:hypothetical protein